jgi:hypothetical protein
MAGILIAQQDAEHREQRQEPESNREHWEPPLVIAADPVDPATDCGGPTIKDVCRYYA